MSFQWAVTERQPMCGCENKKEKTVLWSLIYVGLWRIMLSPASLRTRCRFRSTMNLGHEKLNTVDRSRTSTLPFTKSNSLSWIVLSCYGYHLIECSKFAESRTAACAGARHSEKLQRMRAPAQPALRMLASFSSSILQATNEIKNSAFIIGLYNLFYTDHK